MGPYWMPSISMPSLRGIELLLGDRAEGAHAVAAQPAGGGQFEHALQATIIGDEQQALGVDIEPADGDDARQAFSSSASKMVGRPSGSFSVTTRPAGLW